MTPDLTSIVALLPLKLQTKAKAIAAAVVTVLSAVLPILNACGVALPGAVAVVVPVVLAALIPVAVYVVPNGSPRRN